MKELFRPYVLAGDELVRVGSGLGDGGYIVPKSILSKCDVLYSYGIGGEISFELDWSRMTGKPAHLFDHTIDNPPSLSPGMRFYKQGLSGFKTIDTDNLINHIYNNGDNYKNVLVKMDVENWEYDWLNNTSMESLKNIECLTIEFHNVSQPPFRKAIEKLKEYYNIVWTHGNILGGGFWHTSEILPNVLEITLLKKVGHSYKGLIQRNLPIEIDRPSDGVSNDMVIRYV